MCPCHHAAGCAWIGRQLERCDFCRCRACHGTSRFAEVAWRSREVEAMQQQQQQVPPLETNRGTKQACTT
jgi:hypothetical protein